MDTGKVVRIAALGDIHVRESDKGKWNHFFKDIAEQADIIVLCGDLTDTGHLQEAVLLGEELKGIHIPIVGVLGNHDYELDHQEEIRHELVKHNVHILDGESIILKGVGFAGTKGFGGGFDKHMLPLWGEKMNKKYVQESVEESLKLDKALARLDDDLKKVVILHYSPIKSTVVGEPEQIFPFLGSSRLADTINRRSVEVTFHGHAHLGSLYGETSKGVKVYNVSKPLLEKSGYKQGFFLYEIAV